MVPLDSVKSGESNGVVCLQVGLMWRILGTALCVGSQRMWPYNLQYEDCVEYRTRTGMLESNS